ncbi:IclR family transcriptional regulator [Halorubrum halodurans]|uniref:IclR family transcriptional regulator n=1 Tax=Halorubrum halodurans TaxID=1383851 RepID=A0A256IGE0_9EURY|nr:IclR family transcriptional regulator [Halorubrum halodurans]OYR55212.1 hypothetical protein DJ70_12395 [Halorubrum halodurans]
MTRSDRGVRATTISLSILDYVACEDGVTLTEIANELDIANSTAHNHLSTLLDHRILSKDGRKYHLGVRLFHFGECARTYDPVYDLARQTIWDLAKTTNSEADFLVEDGGRMISLYDVMENNEETDFNVGEYYYMHSSATGKATLATLPEEQIHEILDNWGMPKQTENTITNREKLFEELEEIREQGYAINNQEITEGLYSVGTVVREPTGDPLGGISIGGPTYRLSQDTIDQTVRPLLDAVELLESRIEAVRTDP